MAPISLDFSLRTSPNCKAVHLVGSWDNYAGQLPLAKNSSKSGSWKGTFKFQGTSLREGQRYWYYYIVDGFYVSHDPGREHVVEPTTGRKLNTLDVPIQVPRDKYSRTGKRSSHRHSKQMSIEVARGRALDPSQIKSPKPVKPGLTRKILTTDYSTMYLYDHFAAQLEAIDRAASSGVGYDSDSDIDSDLPSLSSSRGSSPSSVSSSSSSACSCQGYRLSPLGQRVKIDCKGARCGGFSDDDDCSSEIEDDGECYAERQMRRHAIYLDD